MPRRVSQRKKQSSTSGTLAEISCQAVGKLLRRANKGGTSKKKMVPEFQPEHNGTQVLEPILQPKTSEVGQRSRNPMGDASAEEKCGNVSLDQGYLDSKEEMDDSDWEDGTVPKDDHPMTIELDVTPDSAVRKQSHRASAKDKDLAELVHKVHLLCLLARGRLVDSACDDPLIQASLLSLLPAHLVQLPNVTKLTSKALNPLVSWFHDNFHVRSTNAEKPVCFALASALESREGSPEEIAALSVALFRALNLTARFVSILDAASLKPDQSCRQDASGSSKEIFTTSTPMVSKLKLDFKSPKKSLSSYEIDKVCESSLGRSRKSKKCSATSHMAQSVDPPISEDLYWAEVYCSEENLTGKWVHIDAVNLIIDGEDKVESMVAACKTSLRYVVAFGGQGAKDVTRRYCMKWYKIASQRVCSTWWDSVLAPLRVLESGAIGGVVQLRANQSISTESNMGHSFVPTRSSLEDIELETRALTEPLPTSQQAYKSHPLYAIEKWLTKYQVLHPKCPILGFCSGHPVYPRTCVQTVKTKERWLREGLHVKAGEHPVKEIKRSIKPQKVQDSGADDYDCSDSKENIKLYGMWQLEPLNLPPAVNGIVPKNERGQVEVWSEKCLPPGTVHFRFPRAFSVAKRLEIDYAPAMVGFEFKNGRSHPVYDGIVVCAEFEDVLLEAYAEEDERRQAEEKRRDEAQADVLFLAELPLFNTSTHLAASKKHKVPAYLGEVADLTEKDMIAFRRKQKRALLKEKQRADEVVVAAVGEHAESADSSATETDLVRRKRQKVASPPAIPITTVPATDVPASPSPQPSPAARVPPTWTQILQNFEGPITNPVNSLWDCYTDFSQVADRTVMSADVERFSSLGVLQSCQAMIASSLRAASFGHLLEKELIGFDNTKSQLVKNFEVANKQSEKYSEMSKELRLELDRKDIEKQRLDDQVADLERQLREQKLIVAEKQSALDTATAEVTTLKDKLATEAIKLDKTVFKLKNDLVNKFEDGFDKAVRQIKHFAPTLDTLSMGAFRVFHDGQWIEPPEEEDEE